MAENIKILANRADIVAVADAVRAKTGTSEKMTLKDMVDSINNISNGNEIECCPITITNNTGCKVRIYGGDIGHLLSGDTITINVYQNSLLVFCVLNTPSTNNFVTNYTNNTTATSVNVVSVHDRHNTRDVYLFEIVNSSGAITLDIKNYVPEEPEGPV